MNYITQLMSVFGKLGDFITANQFLILALMFFGAYFLNKWIDYKARVNPEFDIYDKLRPGSAAVFDLVQKAVDYGFGKGVPSAVKLKEYMKQIEKFELLFKTDKLRAIKELMAFYLSMKAKVEKTSANPSVSPMITESSVAEE